MKQYLILLKGKGALDYSPQELQRRIEEYREWVDTIQDRFVSDNRLGREGAHIISKENIKTDGPFLEAKEIIAGFIIIHAESLDAAIEVSGSCPLLKYFEMIVRPMVEE